MRTIDYLTDPLLAPLYRPAVIVALAVALLGAVLSVFVVLKRLAFIGQGVSHAAFGGVGLALAIGGWAASGVGLSAVVVTFSMLAAVGIAMLSQRRGTRPDTAIGIVLGVAMAAGFMLHRVAQERAAAMGMPPPPELERVLFGDILSLGMTDVWLTLAVTAGVFGVLWWFRRPILFWAFDEAACEAFGVRARAMQMLVLLLVALGVVMSVKLAGIVLATAVFVLPGATALALSHRLRSVLAISALTGLLGAAGGLVFSFERDLQPGPSIVIAMAVLYGVARLVSPVMATVRRA